MSKIIYEALTFDDVLLVPAYSEVLPNEVSLETNLTKKIKLRTPIISSPMDTVTESKMAIAMALVGGIGIIHKNLPPLKLAAEIKKVKSYTNFIVRDPITISPYATISEALYLMNENNYSGMPVVSATNKLLGILTNRDLRFSKNPTDLVENVMKRDNLITVSENIEYEEALNMMHKHHIERLLVVNEDYECVGLITMSDIQRINNLANYSMDTKARPLVGVALGVNYKDYIDLIMAEEPDLVVIDTAHGHSKGVIGAVKSLKLKYPDLQIIAGNIATVSAALALIEAGADAVKVGIGPGSICTTRIVTGVGVPQLTAIMEVSKVCKEHNVPLIADGGIKYSGDISKAIAAGADSVMLGSLLAQAEESPGEIIIYEGRNYKLYRGMGSSGAMSKGSADRYGQSHLASSSKFVPEGVEGMVPMRDKVKEIIYNLSGGLRSAMGYTGNNSIAEMQKNAQMVKITGAGLKESHVHNIIMTKENSNYSGSN